MNLSNIQYSDFSKARELELFTINIAWWHFQLMAWMLHNSEVLLDCILRSVLKLKMVPCDSLFTSEISWTAMFSSPTMEIMR